MITEVSMKDISKYIDRRFCPDKVLCNDEAYRSASDRFSEIISVIEHELPQEKEIITELIITRAVLETAVGKHMYRKGLINKWKSKSS